MNKHKHICAYNLYKWWELCIEKLLFWEIGYRDRGSKRERSREMKNHQRRWEWDQKRRTENRPMESRLGMIFWKLGQRSGFYYPDKS